ncbi:MAG: PTS sugar transporter subunit IIA [candidate division WOR-3 bacterium]
MLSEILKAERIKFDIDGSSKEEIINILLEGYDFNNKSLLVEEILSREAIMSTAPGKGIAIIRGFTSEVETPSLTIGLSKRGIDFASLDHAPVRIFFLFIFPRDFKDYPYYIASALSLLNQETVRTRLPDFISAQELIKFISQKEV